MFICFHNYFVLPLLEKNVPLLHPQNLHVPSSHWIQILGIVNYTSQNKNDITKKKHGAKIT